MLVDPLRNHRKRWTKKEEILVATKLNDGVDCSDVAKMVGRTTTAVLRRCKKIRKYKLQRNNCRWQNQELKQLKRLVEKRVSVKQIAATLRRSEQAIIQRRAIQKYWKKQ